MLTLQLILLFSLVYQCAAAGGEGTYSQPIEPLKVCVEVSENGGSFKKKKFARKLKGVFTYQ